MDLSARQQDGLTLREHLQVIAARGGEVDPRLVAQPPSGCEPIWSAFVSLSGARRAGLGPSALTMTDIEAWCRLNGVRLTPWELDTLLRLDAVSVARAIEHQTKKGQHE